MVDLSYLRNILTSESPKKILTSTRRSEKTIAGLPFPRGLRRTIVSDTKYKFFSQDEYLGILKSIDIGKYVADYLDCDDRTLWVLANVKANPELPTFWGAAIGEARGKIKGHTVYHSLIVFWDTNKKRHYYEPTTKKLVDFEPKEIYI